MIILIPKRTSQVHVANKMIKKKLKHTNRRITQMIILPTKIMSQVQVTEKICTFIYLRKIQKE